MEDWEIEVFYLTLKEPGSRRAAQTFWQARSLPSTLDDVVAVARPEALPMVAGGIARSPYEFLAAENSFFFYL